jgi:hypothetical protein
MDEGALGIRGSLSEEAHCRRCLERAPVLGTLKDMLSKTLELVSIFIGAPHLGNMGGTLFS